MYAIIRQGGGKYYLSTVFGYFHDARVEDDYQRYLERIHSPYFVVWNEEKTHLVKVFEMQPNTKYLIPQVLIVDTDTDSWIEDSATGMGCINFLTREIADRLCDTQEMPPDIFEQCICLEQSVRYDPCPEVKAEADIINLASVSGGFHDAYIRSLELSDDGALHVHFAGTWGCEIDVWFWGDVSYHVQKEDPQLDDPFWYDSSVFFENGYIYLVDETNMTSEKIDDNYHWFKARHMKYRVTPN